jgi:glycosyltransferase involved in cell wall biosynthesis/tetratricopeptide (TPR) repeat protein
MADIFSDVPTAFDGETVPFDLATATLQQIKALVAPSFDAEFYRRRYQQFDDAIDVLDEFCRAVGGGRRDPNERFSSWHYLWIHGDVRQSGVLPFAHFLVHGERECRFYCRASRDRLDGLAFDDLDVVRRDMAITAEAFDAGYYRDVDAGCGQPPLDALEHFCRSGWREGRDPNDWFSTRLYLLHYPDVGEIGINPFAHYLLWGKAEQRGIWPPQRLRARLTLAADFELAEIECYFNDCPAGEPSESTGSSIEPDFEPDAPSGILGLPGSRIPEDFLPLDYQRVNGDLIGITDDGELLRHFLEFGIAEKRKYKREFDEKFYRKLYFSTEPWRSTQELLAHFASSGRLNFANTDEALQAGGFTSSGWLALFNVRSYIVSNGLAEDIVNDAQAIVHFMSVGIASLLPVSEHLWFDAPFYGGMSGAAEICSTETELYRHWLEFGWSTGAPPNGTEFVRSLGLDIPGVPAGFDYAGYLLLHPELRAIKDHKHRLFEHYIRHSVLDAFRPFRSNAASASLFRHIGDHHSRNGNFSLANSIYERALVLDQSDAKLVQHVADLALREKNYPRALSYYRQIRDMGGGSYWTFLNGGRVAIQAGFHAEAVNWAKRGLQAYPRAIDFINLAAAGSEKQIDEAIADHIVQCQGGVFDGADLHATVEGIFDSMLASECLRYSGEFNHDGVPQAPPAGKPLQVIMLANEDLPQCTHYRVRQKADQESCGNFTFRSFVRGDNAGFIDACADADVALFYRLAIGLETLQCLATCRRLKIPTFYEIDDLVFSPEHFPDALVSYAGAIDEDQHFRLQCGTALVAAFARLCDFAIASTNALADQMVGLVRQRQAIVHRNGLSHAMERIAKASVTNFRAKARDEVVIFYGSGTLAHGADFRQIVSIALDRLMTNYPNVRFCCCGHVASDDLQQKFPGRVDVFPLIPDHQHYLGLLSQCDINIAILRESPFNHCKSEIKWLEAAVCGVPTIASDVQGFRDCLDINKEILLAKPKANDWFKKLEGLVVSREQRTSIGLAAARKALARYQPATMGRALERDLRRCLGASIPAMPTAGRTKMRILLMNVFASPQSIGGATRIFDAQVALLKQHYGDEFELAVCCGNNESAEPYGIETYVMANDVRVYSINTPLREHMDWIPSDEMIVAPFERVMEHFQPRLIHLHCIQRLTSVVVSVATRRRIPVIVTLHDAWWIADFQFLMDETDRLIKPECWPAFADSNQHSPVASAARRLALAVSLRQAAAIVAVSESFATVYRSCGFENVTVIENGLNDLSAVPEKLTSSGNIVLGHVGGISYHKGYFLFRRSVIEAGLGNLDVVVVDHAMREGEVRTESWGCTTVRFIGKISQAHIGKLYAQIDVLVAPSMWPESFGLVTREAAHYGKWMIASNRGALAEPVVPGQNGFVIDVGTTHDLVDSLRIIAAAPERFKAPPEHRVVCRSSRDQMEDYVRLYRTVLSLGRPSRQSDGRRSRQAKQVAGGGEPDRVLAHAAAIGA